jgi:hypothetical protein
MNISRKHALLFCVLGAIILGLNRYERVPQMVCGASCVFLGVYTLNNMAKAKEEIPPSSASEEE